jgi:predicted dehydrogenase
MAALSKRIAVFCQKPLARTASEAREVIAAAREADRLLAVDLSYRHTRAMQLVRDLIQRGELGAVYAVDLVFHNGYGPDKAWFHDVELSGGGCLIDLATHLIDLALWSLAFPRVDLTSSALYSGGELLSRGAGVTEDYATCELRLETGTTVRIVCSWNRPVGADAVIGAQFHGTQGGALFSNVGGSFYDFRAERFTGTGSETLVEPPDDWGGRAAVAWVERLRRSPGFDSEVEQVLATAQVLDAAYGRDETPAHH